MRYRVEQERHKELLGDPLLLSLAEIKIQDEKVVNQ